MNWKTTLKITLPWRCCCGWTVFRSHLWGCLGKMLESAIQRCAQFQSPVISSTSLLSLGKLFQQAAGSSVETWHAVGTSSGNIPPNAVIILRCSAIHNKKVGNYDLPEWETILESAFKIPAILGNLMMFAAKYLFFRNPFTGSREKPLAVQLRSIWSTRNSINTWEIILIFPFVCTDIFIGALLLAHHWLSLK